MRAGFVVWVVLCCTSAFSLPLRYANEWTFDQDPQGVSLSEALNTGTSDPAAQFGPGFSDTLFTAVLPGAGQGLLCIGRDMTPDGTGTWTDGAVLDAGMTGSGSGVHYLRYDVEYDLGSVDRGGAVLGIFFTGESGERAAGLALRYDYEQNDAGGVSSGAGYTASLIGRGLDLTGRVTAIAEVDLDAGTIRVWYTTGGMPPDYDAPAYSGPMTLSSIDNLRLHATGDFRPDGSTDYAAVDNLRHTIGVAPGGAAWEEIVEPLVDLTAQPALSATVSDSLDGAMEVGETNVVTVVVRNPVSGGRSHPVTEVTSDLIHDGDSAAFTIISNNPPVALLLGGESVTNTYQVIAHEHGRFGFEAIGISAETNSPPALLDLVVGRFLQILPVKRENIEEISGGQFDNFYEPGETLHITITTINSGALPVSHTLNTLSAPSGFSVSALSGQTYGVMNAGETNATVYEVVISPDTPFGIYSFDVVNSGSGESWTDSFDLEVSTRFPQTDWLKADNNDDLNQPSSWVLGQVPDSTDRAVLDQTAQAPLATQLGEDLAWRGIALASNTVDWTIGGTNMLSIGSAGIDMAQAQGDLRLDSRVHLSTTQSWNVAVNRSIDVPGILSSLEATPLVKKGKGSLLIRNPANTAFRGGLRIEEGTLRVAGNQVLGSGEVAILGSTLSTEGITSLSNRVVIEDPVLIDNAHALSLTGPVSGTGQLRKTGPGLLALNGVNTYSGGTINHGLIEVGSPDALGSGTLTMQAGSTLQAGFTAFSFNNPGIANAVELAGDATLTTVDNTSIDLLKMQGPIRGEGRLTVQGRQVLLYANNTFRGGLDLRQTDWLRVSGPQSLGTGPIRSLDGTRMIRFGSGGTVPNEIRLDGSLRSNLNNRVLEFSGPISGPGDLDLRDSGGTLTLSGDNSGWSGNIPFLRGNKRLRINHLFALGTGSFISLGGFVSGRTVLEINADIPGGIAHDMDFGLSYNLSTGEASPVEFLINRDVRFTGTLSDAGSPVNFAGIEKTGPAALVLDGTALYVGPTHLLEGSLEVNGLMQGDLIARPGTVLRGSGTVHSVSVESGATIEFRGPSLTFNEPPQIQPGTAIILGFSNASNYGVLRGNGSAALALSGTLTIDFSGGDVVPGDALHILRNWTSLVDHGTEVVARNLRADLALDTARLFVDGRVELVTRDVPPPPPVEPGDVVKDNNNDALNLVSSWVGDRIPGAQNRARLDSRIPVPLATPLGADTSWRGITMVSNQVDWAISGSHTLTLGPAGVDMSRAGADLRMEARLAVGSGQKWEIAEGRRMTVAGHFMSSDTKEVVKTGEGKLVFPAGPQRGMAGELVMSNGTLAVSGGFNRLDDLRVETGAPPVGSGRIRFSDGTMLSTAEGPGGLGNPLRIDEGMLRVKPGQNLLLAGSIGGPGGLMHSGSGVLRLAGANSYSGGTIVESGSILEFTHYRAFGQGPITLRDGAAIHGWLPMDERLPIERTIYNSIFVEGNAVIRSLANQNNQNIIFAGSITGPGRVRVVLPFGANRNIILASKNTFKGGLELMKQGGNVLLMAAAPHSLGSGDIIFLSEDMRMMFNQSGGQIRNRIDLRSGSMNFANHPRTAVEFSGEIFGSGSVSLVNRPGDVRLSADNRNWSGGISGIGSYNTANGIKRVIVDHPFALGTGEIVLGGYTERRNYIEIHLRAPVATSNDLFVAESGPQTERNDLFMVGRDSIFGKLDGVANHQGLDKTGPARMTLTAQGNYPSPFNVRGGVLDLDNAGFPGKTTVFPGAGLVTDNARTGPVRIRSGGAIDVKGGGLRTEGGALTLDGDALMTLRLSSAQAGPGYVPLLAGDGTGDLTLSGTLLVDFSKMVPAPVSGDSVALFGSWTRMVNNGVTILVAGLDEFMTLDSSTLFTDGRVRVVAGGRLGSQELSIRVTSGGTGSASVQVRNPENVTRNFKLQPGAEWPSWLSAAPTSARTPVGPGAQATVSVTANATGLPAGTHRFMLPVVWEHGVTDLILVTVQVEGPSLSVVPGTLNLPVVENTTGEGTVDLVNTGTLPVSYRIRRVLPEHEVYTQPAADVPWIPVSPTAQTEITSFTSGRSTPRAIGFGFPFFGTTETEVSVGIDGTLWFGGKPAIRAFSNQLSYLSGTSKVTAKPEADRFIVTWSRMVQPDSAQQTFQAVLHRDGRIDLRYHTIVADSAWRNATIGLHGPTQWFPAQVPETLQGRTIRFKRDEQIARISIPEISGTVAAGANKTITVMGDATGLSAGASRAATFAVDYDGGITGTAGEVAVTMDVVAAAGDPVGDELVDPVISFDPDGQSPAAQMLVLNPPQRTADGGRHLSWDVYPGDGYSGYQPHGSDGVYHVQWTTNLASGLWTDLATVTDEAEYIDKNPMDGPVIFYRVVKEKD